MLLPNFSLLSNIYSFSTRCFYQVDLTNVYFVCWVISAYKSNCHNITFIRLFVIKSFRYALDLSNLDLLNKGRYRLDLLMLKEQRVLVSKRVTEMMIRIDIELLIKIAYYVSYHPNVSSHPVTKSSPLVLRNFLFILTLNFSVFQSLPAMCQIGQKCLKTCGSEAQILQVSSSSILIILI